MFPVYQREQLDALFTPKTVAVIGESEGGRNLGSLLVRNLRAQPFSGTTYIVDPHLRHSADVPAYPSLADVPTAVDLALIATPAAEVPEVIAQCTATGVQAAIVLSAGFRETGTVGIALEEQIFQRAWPTACLVREGNRPARVSSATPLTGSRPLHPLRIVGPNCLALMRPSLGLNATLLNSLARPGKVAFISQSGALGAAILDWSKRENIGLARFHDRCRLGRSNHMAG